MDDVSNSSNHRFQFHSMQVLLPPLRFRQIKDDDWFVVTSSVLRRKSILTAFESHFDSVGESPDHFWSIPWWRPLYCKLAYSCVLCMYVDYVSVILLDDASQGWGVHRRLPAKKHVCLDSWYRKPDNCSLRKEGATIALCTHEYLILDHRKPQCRSTVVNGH